MKMKSLLKGIVLVLVGTSSCFIGSDAHATVTGDAHNGSGGVTITDEGTTKPVDPENPGTGVDPGPGPSTDGQLRIDFVSALKFGSASTTGTNRRYSSLAQQFHNEDVSARGFYIQVTDRRAAASGWRLNLTQNSQFTSEIIQDLDNQDLEGAVLSFGNGWANSTSMEGLPTVGRDTLAINEIGTPYTVATAAQGQGKGIWTIAFGASDGNTFDQASTITPLTDSKGNPVMDTTFNKPAYSNSAVTLFVPDTTKIYPVQYTTTLTWTLEAGPT